MIHPYYNEPYFNRLLRTGEFYIILQYLFTGTVVTAVDYGTFVLFYNITNTGLLVATVLAYIAGLTVSYVLSRYWVFKKGATGEAFTTSSFRYGVLLFINLIITYLMLLGMQTWFGLTPLLGKFVVGFFMIFWIYGADKYWVFRGPRQLSKKPVVGW